MNQAFRFAPFSKKQKKLLTWWVEGSPVADKDGIIADGSVRSGKTVIMSLSYIMWAMSTFKFETFGMAGKTISSFRRNVLTPLKPILFLRGYSVEDKRSENMIIVRKDGVENYFRIFGGKDESSQDLVQGLTAAGFFFDEVALMPESFINQAVARCSVEGAKLWFNCNPEGPFHFFKVNWIDQLKEKNLLRLHFELDDNPSLSDKVKQRYRTMFSGVFFDRYILGLWVMAEGLIYSMFDRKMIIDTLPPNVRILKKWVGVDYGQSNATVFLLVGLGTDNTLYILDEYYHIGKDAKIQKSPSVYSKDYFKWLKKNGVEGMPVRKERTFIDPSAKGFMLQLYQDGENDIRQADNDVNRGIELLSSIIQKDRFRVLSACSHTIVELGSYSWDEKAQERGIDAPKKTNDHAMDALRYVVNGTRPIWQRIVQNI